MRAVGSTQSTHIFVPYLLHSYGGVDFQRTDYVSGDWDDAHAGSAAELTNAMYAKFTLVPIPGAMWLLGSGLIGIAGIRRKFKK